MNTPQRGFASDNNAGVHPLVLNALKSVNDGHEIAYGDDQHTQRVIRRMKKIFGEESEIFFVFTGKIHGMQTAHHPHTEWKTHHRPDQTTHARFWL
jgi:threonine aldolase